MATKTFLLPDAMYRACLAASRKQARIIILSRKILVNDNVGSAETEVKDGDSIQIGKMSFIFDSVNGVKDAGWLTK